MFHLSSVLAEATYLALTCFPLPVTADRVVTSATYLRDDLGKSKMIGTIR